MKTREEAFDLLKEWVKSESLRKHCIAVATAMEKYAIKFNAASEDIDVWWSCGLLHDMDYERFPDVNIHPIEGCKELREREYDGRIIEAILGHNERTGIKRHSQMAKTLFAVDELCGLVIALAKVRPGNFQGMNFQSIKKAMKKKDFAAAISRESILKGIAELEVLEDEHFTLVIEALNSAKKDLGF